MSDIDIYAVLNKHSKLSNEHSSKVNTVLSAINEILKVNRSHTGGKELTASPPTAIEYFGAIMTTLDADSRSREYTSDLLFLLSVLLPYVPHGVLKAKFNEITTFLMSYLSDDEEDVIGGSVYKYILSCLGSLLLVIDPTNETMYNSKSVIRTVNTLLSYSVGKIPKARREAHRILIEVILSHKEGENTYLGEKTATFCGEVIEKAYRGQDATQTLQLLTLLRNILPVLPSSAALTLSKSLLRFLTSDNILLVLGSFRTLSAYISDGRSIVTANQMTSFLDLIFDVAPDPTSPDIASEYVLLVTAVVLKLKQVDTSTKVIAEYLPKAIESLCGFYSSDDRNLTKVVQKSLRDLLLNCVDNIEDESYITEVIQIFEALTSYRFQNAWNAIVEPMCTLYQVVVRIFPSPVAAVPLLSKLTIGLVDMYEAGIESGEDHSIHVHRVLSIAVGCLGAECFISMVPLSSSEKPGELHIRREWILPLVEINHGRSVPTSLSFFGKHILSMARNHESLSKAVGMKPKDVKWHQHCSIALWKLLPTWCEVATDAAIIFPNMVKTLVAAASDAKYPELGKIIAIALSSLIRCNLDALNESPVVNNEEKEEEFRAALYAEEDGGDKDDNDSEDEDGLEDEQDFLTSASSNKAKRQTHITPAMARANIDAIAPFCSKMLPVLFSLYDQAHGLWQAPPAAAPHLGYGLGGDGAKANSILEAISAVAEITAPDVLSNLFHTLMKKLLSATNAMTVDGGGDGSSRRTAVILMGTVAALIKPLTSQDIVLLYRLVKPTVSDSVISLLQQRSYGVLFQMCSWHPSWVSENVVDITTLLRSSLLTVTSSAKKSRLRSLGRVVQGLEESNRDHLNLMPELLGEVMLCLKESNKRTRAAAFDLIVVMAQKMESAGNKNPASGASLAEFIKMVIAGLAATTPHMRSATVLALARLMFEYKSDPSLLEMAPTILKLTLMLLNEKSREVIKSVLGFTKVMISALDGETLAAFLPDICSGILVWSGESKNRFRQKIRHILERLVRKFDYETVLSHVPESDVKLMSHIRKTKERANKKKKKGVEDISTNESNKTSSLAVGLGNGNTKFTSNDVEDEKMESDNEDEQKWVNATKRSISKSGAWLQDDKDAPLDLLDGQNVARNMSSSKPSSLNKKRGRSDVENDFEVNTEGKMMIEESEDEKEMEKSKMDIDEEDEEKDVETSYNKSKKERFGGNKRLKSNDGKSLSVHNKKKITGGDVTKGGVQPYAFLPLDPRFLNRKMKKDAPRQYTNIVQAVKKRRKEEKKSNRNSLKY